MSKKKTGHTTTKNTQKKSVKNVKASNATFQQNVDLFKDGDGLVGVMCVIEYGDITTPIRFAFPKSRILMDLEGDMEAARDSATSDIGMLYYALQNYEDIKGTLAGHSRPQVFNMLVEAIGAFIVIITQINKDNIAANFKAEDSMGIVFGFTFSVDPAKEKGNYSIHETQVGLHFSDYQSWVETTNEWKEQMAAEAIALKSHSPNQIIIS
jgi:hypothetical protein